MLTPSSPSRRTGSKPLTGRQIASRARSMRAPGRRRNPAGRWVESHRGAYLVTGTVLRSETAGETALGCLPARRSSIPLVVGDSLVLTRSQEPGRPATPSAPARISCSLVEAFEAVAVGDSVWLDDGKFGDARRVSPDEIEVEITQAPPGGGKLRAEKGINLPDTRLAVKASSVLDEAISFAVAQPTWSVRASSVSTAGPTSARSPTALARNGGDHVRVDPEDRDAQGLDVARPTPDRGGRGCALRRHDRAWRSWIEVGLGAHGAEVQEEILWLCEAAHVPVIWATHARYTRAH